MYNTRSIIRMFFVLLFVGLLLGDGKQSVIDVYGATVALLLWGLYLFSGGKAGTDSSLISRLWLVAGGAALVSTVFSDSIGYSVSWWVRFLAGYLVYRLFKTLSSDTTGKEFIRGALGMVAGACGLSFIAQIAPGFGTVLPSMNLISLVYGHNHLSDLLVFGAPFLLYTLPHIQPKLQGFIILVYLIFFIATFSAGAWIIVSGFGLYILFGSWRGKGVNIRSRWGKILLLPVLVLLVIVLVRSVMGHVSWVPVEISRRIDSKAGSLLSRIGYWRQAIEAASENPFFGTGPGTFILTSKRLHGREETPTWLTHSLPLELLSEMGIVGIVSFAILGVGLWKNKRAASCFKPVYESIVLLLVYSLFEYTIDYFVVWLLLFASIGLIMGKKYTTQNTGRTDPVIGISIGFIGVFYVLWTISTLVCAVTKQYDLAFYIAPFDTTITSVYLETADADMVLQPAARLMRLLHAKNPDVLYGLGKLGLIDGNRKDATGLIEAGVRADPYNHEYHTTLLTVYADLKEKEKYARHIEYLCALWAAPDTRCNFEQYGYDPAFIEDLFFKHKEFALSSYGYPVRLQKLFYFSGLEALATDPELTRDLWKAARDIDESLGYIHVELTSLEYWVFHDDAAARRILDRCMKNTDAAGACGLFTHELSSLPRVGSMAVNMEKNY